MSPINPSIRQTMTVAQARQVMWLKNDSRYYRPMGELLDSGYLSTSRLMWAAENAYSKRLRDAAQVLLLEQTKPGPDIEAIPAPPAPTASQQLDTPLTYKQAHKVAYPLPPYKGKAMGELLDERLIGLKELGNIAETAWTVQARRAAITLMAKHLDIAANEVDRPKGILNVISPEQSYSEERERRLRAIQNFFYGVFIALFIVYIIKTIQTFDQEYIAKTAEVLAKGLVGWIALAILLIGGSIIGMIIGLILTKADKSLDKQIDLAQKGQTGEESVLDALRQSLNSEWTYINNLTIPGRNKADIDGVLIGPSGIWAMEVKNYSGAFAHIGDKWQFKTKKGIKDLRKSPSIQARKNAARLAQFLGADGIQQWVAPIVIWANPESELKVKHPTVPVWRVEHLQDELGNLQRDHDIPSGQREAIINKLTDVVELNKRKDKKQ